MKRSNVPGVDGTKTQTIAVVGVAAIVGIFTWGLVRWQAWPWAVPILILAAAAVAAVIYTGTSKRHQ